MKGPTHFTQALVFALVVGAACRPPDPQPAAEATTESIPLVLSPTTSDVSGEQRYSLRLQDAGALNVAAYRVILHFDTTALRYDRISARDSMLTVANDLGGRVVVAGASAFGFGDAEWVTVVFRRVGDAAPVPPSVELFEVADVDGRDVRQRIRTEPGLASPISR